MMKTYPCSSEQSRLTGRFSMTIWCDANTAVQIVESGDRVFVQGACVTPTPLIEALVARGEDLRNVELTHLHSYGPTPYTDERWRGHFFPVSYTHLTLPTNREE